MTQTKLPLERDSILYFPETDKLAIAVEINLWPQNNSYVIFVEYNECYETTLISITDYDFEEGVVNVIGKL